MRKLKLVIFFTVFFFFLSLKEGLLTLPDHCELQKQQRSEFGLLEQPRYLGPYRSEEKREKKLPSVFLRKLTK
jgi:hypothetical protein